MTREDMVKQVQQEIKELQEKLKDYQDVSEEKIKFLARELFKEVKLTHNISGTSGVDSIHVHNFYMDRNKIYIGNTITGFDITTKLND